MRIREGIAAAGMASAVWLLGDYARQEAAELAEIGLSSVKLPMTELSVFSERAQAMYIGRRVLTAVNSDTSYRFSLGPDDPLNSSLILDRVADGPAGYSRELQFDVLLLNSYQYVEV